MAYKQRSRYYDGQDEYVVTLTPEQRELLHSIALGTQRVALRTNPPDQELATKLSDLLTELRA